jgi:ferredoxin
VRPLDSAHPGWDGGAVTEPKRKPTGAGFVLGPDGRYLPAETLTPPPGAPAGSPPAPPVLRRPRGADRAAPVPQARAHGTPPAGLTGPLRQLLGPVTGSLRLLTRAHEDAEQVLKVDWPQCRAHGLCHEVVPEVIQLDEWGYPFFDGRPVSGDELAAVRKAVQACPTLALRLVDAAKH